MTRTKTNKNPPAVPDRRQSRHVQILGMDAPRWLSHSPARVAAAGAFLIAIVTTVCYLPAMSGGFVWDDDAHVYRNECLHSLNGLHRIWFVPGAVQQYYPVTYTSFWLEHHVWGDAPAGYHVVNIGLHICNALLVWSLLHLLKVRGAWIIALLFSVHPVNVETAAWVSERKNTLSGFFYLLSMLAYLRQWRRGTDGEIWAHSGRVGESSANPPPAGGYIWYAASLVLFTLAVLSKSTTATMPAAVLLLLWWKTGALPPTQVIRLAPFFAVGIAMGLTTVWVERHFIGAAGAAFDYSFAERSLIAGRAFWFYALKIAAPFNLAFIYPRWHIDGGVWHQYLFPAGFLLVVISLLVFRRRWGRGPLASVLFFSGTLFPALGFYNVYPFRFSFVADHFQYLAGIGAITLYWSLAERLPWFSRNVKVRLGAACGFTAVLAVLTWHQASIYKSPVTLWEDTLAKNPDAWIAYVNLGEMYLDAGRYDGALRLLEKAQKYGQDLHKVYNNCAVIYLRRGRLDDARRACERAIAAKPDYVKATRNLAIVMERQGRLDSALALYNRALRIEPLHAGSYHSAATIALAQEQPQLAAQYLARAAMLKVLNRSSAALYDSLRTALQRR